MKSMKSELQSSLIAQTLTRPWNDPSNVFIKFTQLSYFNYNHLKQLYLFIETFSHDSFVRQAVSTFDIWLRESSVKITFNLDLVGYIKWVSVTLSTNYHWSSWYMMSSWNNTSVAHRTELSFITLCSQRWYHNVTIS